MISTKKYTEQLIIFFKHTLLEQIAKEDPHLLQKLSVNNNLEMCAYKLPIEFELGQLFDITWRLGKKNGIELPTSSNYAKDFNEFCNQLMNPWPLKEIELNCLRIIPSKKTRHKVHYRYKILQFNLENNLG
jgi:hypothetical protein